MFGQHLKLWRKHKGLTQEEVADLIHVDQSVYCKWEKGLHKPPMDRLEALAGLYGTELQLLVSGNVTSAPGTNGSVEDATGQQDYLREVIERKDKQIEETQSLLRRALEMLSRLIPPPGGGGKALRIRTQHLQVCEILRHC